MPFDYLQPDIQDQQFNDNRTVPRQRFNHKADVTGTGQWLVLPAGIGEVLASVAPASGTARVEYTQDPISAIDAGTAVGKPWTAGEVSAYADSIMTNAVTAIRCVATATAEFKVTA